MKIYRNTNMLAVLLVTALMVMSCLAVHSNLATSAIAESTSRNVIGTAMATASTIANSPKPVETNPTIMHIDAAIGSVKDGNNDEGKKHLLQAEKSLEGNPSVADAEKRIEAAIKALSDGDSNASIKQAEEAKRLLASS